MSPPTPDCESACYYGVLGLDKSATATEVKKAYRKRALETHPDKPGGSEEDFKKVDEAYKVLKDPEKRKLYDQFGKAAFEQGSGCSEQAGQHSNPFHFASGSNTFQFGGAGGLEAIFRMFSESGSDGFGGRHPFDEFDGIFTGSAFPSRGTSRRSSSPHTIPAGTRVVVQGLARAAQHNGKAGVVASWNAGSGRYQVEIDSGEVLSLRPQSILQLCHVEVTGLESKPELNGQIGKIHGFDEAKGRYVVLVEAPAVQILSLQPSNCILSQGVPVVLQGLSNTSFNTQMAHIVGVHRDACRYTVQTEGGKTIRVKFENARC